MKSQKLSKKKCSSLLYEKQEQPYLTGFAYKPMQKKVLR